MKLFAKNRLMKSSVAILSISILFLSASCHGDPENARTVFADSGAIKGISTNSVSLLENLQNANRQVVSAVLPSVVTLDVVEMKKLPNNAFGFDLPWFFFDNNRKDRKEEQQKEYRAEGLGSGVIVRKSGKTYYVLTNYHVAGSANEINVKLYDGRMLKAKLVGGDQRKDIALVSFDSDDANIPVAHLGDSDSTQVGDIVFAIGSPLGYTSTVTQGIVSAVGRSGGPGNNINDFIQTDAAINQGNSGGPMVNIYGEVIGINSWIASSSGGSQGLGFSIPINNVKRDIDSFIQYGEVKYGWVGVQLLGVDASGLKELGIPADTKGALAADIVIGGPADKGGLRPGDFITQVDGKNIKDVNQLVRDIGNIESGATVVLTVLRNGVSQKISIQVSARDEKVVADASKLWPGFFPITITDELREKLNVKKSIKGIIAANVQPKSPAAIMGIKNGDVITAVNNTPVTSLQQFYKVLSQAQKEVWFDVYRDEQQLVTMHFRLR